MVVYILCHLCRFILGFHEVTKNNKGRIWIETFEYDTTPRYIPTTFRTGTWIFYIIPNTGPNIRIYKDIVFNILGNYSEIVAYFFISHIAKRRLSDVNNYEVTQQHSSYNTMMSPNNEHDTFNADEWLPLQFWYIFIKVTWTYYIHII